MRTNKRFTPEQDDFLAKLARENDGAGVPGTDAVDRFTARWPMPAGSPEHGDEVTAYQAWALDGYKKRRRKVLAEQRSTSTTDPPSPEPHGDAAQSTGPRIDPPYGLQIEPPYGLPPAAGEAESWTPPSATTQPRGIDLTTLAPPPAAPSLEAPSPAPTLSPSAAIDAAMADLDAAPRAPDATLAGTGGALDGLDPWLRHAPGCPKLCLRGSGCTCGLTARLAEADGVALYGKRVRAALVSLRQRGVLPAESDDGVYAVTFLGGRVELLEAMSRTVLGGVAPNHALTDALTRLIEHVTALAEAQRQAADAAAGTTAAIGDAIATRDLTIETQRDYIRHLERQVGAR